MEQEDFDEMYPKFTVKCNVCGSKKVMVDNSLGNSDMSGMWGSVDLVCTECQNRTSIVET